MRARAKLWRTVRDGVLRPERRPAALILEVKGDFCHDIRRMWITIDAAEMGGDEAQFHALSALGFLPHPARRGRFQAHADASVLKHVKAHKITHDRERFESASAMETRLRVEAVNRWYVHDWNTLYNKIRSSIVEGVSVFLSMFSSRPARRPRAVGSVTVRTGLDRAGAVRRPIPASRAAAGRVCHPEGRSGAEDGAAVDTPGS